MSGYRRMEDVDYARQRKNSRAWIALLVILALVPGMVGWPAVYAEPEIKAEIAGDRD